MKSMQLIVISLFLATVLQASDYDTVSNIEAMLNPASRFNIYELQSNGSRYAPQTFGLRTQLNGSYTTSKGVKSFSIDNLVPHYRLIIDIDETGKATPRILPFTQENGDLAEIRIKVSLNDGPFDKSEHSLQSLSKRVEADKRVPKTIVFGIYWDLRPRGGLGPDTVEYSIGFRLEANGPITVITCRHDLKGTVLETPWEAAANVAAGALIADVHTLQGITSETQSLRYAKSSAAKSDLLAILQPTLNSSIIEIEKLSHYTKQASFALPSNNPTEALLAQGKVIAEQLRQLRDPKLCAPEFNAQIDEILTLWERNGIPFYTEDK